jgi:hypothetical protein
MADLRNTPALNVAAELEKISRQALPNSDPATSGSP